MAAGLISLLVTLLVVGLVVGLIIWLIDLLPIIPVTFKVFAKAVIVVIGIIVVIYAALPLLTGAGVR